jgi:hypothetical protein
MDVTSARLETRNEILGPARTGHGKDQDQKESRSMKQRTKADPPCLCWHGGFPCIYRAD